jgi:hypothetical protein
MSAEHMTTSIGFVGHPLPKGIYVLVRALYRGNEPVQTEPIDDPLAPGVRAGIEPGRPWLVKRFVDVTVEGEAHSPRPTEHMQVVTAVAGRAVRLDVWGRRAIDFDGRVPRIGPPEPFTRMDLGWDRAYGGVDPRALVLSELDDDQKAALVGDHPGAYPRNPFGRGYLVTDAARDGLEMPNVEDPDDPLTPERLVVRDPSKWHLQPMPAGFGLMHPRMYARMVHYGVDAWVPPPDDERLAEVRTGLLPPSFRTHLPVEPVLAPHPGFYQEAAPGLRFARIDAGAPIRVEGMRPDGTDLRFRVPKPPTVEIVLEGHLQRLEARLNLIRIRPADDTVELTYAAVTHTMHRIFLPGIHRRIPLAARLDGHHTVPYVPPPAPA